MATLRQYYDTDFAHSMSLDQTCEVCDKSNSVSVITRVHMDFTANAKYASCFVPECENPIHICCALIDEIEVVLQTDNKLLIRIGHFDLSESTDARDLRFTGRLFIYTMTDIPVLDRQALVHQASGVGIALCIRGAEYTMSRAKRQKPMAFISHDSRDKDIVARPIAIGLSRLVCPVWFDEFSLNVGDSLRESIEKGLKESKKCILVLSPRFLSNPGWTKVEFNSIFTREIMEKQNLVLPVWYEVTKEEVYEYCPSLADRKGINWTLGQDEAIELLHRAIVRSNSSS